MASAALVGAAYLLLLSHPAHAQNCKDADSGSDFKTNDSDVYNRSNKDSQTLDCDMTYYNTVIRCNQLKCGSGKSSTSDGNNNDDTSDCDKPFGTMPSCPKDPAPMKDTELKSPIKDLSPYLFASALDPDHKGNQYKGMIYRGTPGDATSVFDMTGSASNDAGNAGNNAGNNNSDDAEQDAANRNLAACGQQLKLPSTASTVDDQAKETRLQIDSCTNRYILNTAADAYHKEDAHILSTEDPTDPSKVINLFTHCQPLNLKLPTGTSEDSGGQNEPEYDAGWYLKEAWTKLLQDASHRAPYQGGLLAKDPPRLPDGVAIANPLTPPDQLSKVTLSQISGVKYEEINDPSHPFSPRWDFENNERDSYSPKTAPYTIDEAATDKKNSVFCAGVREDKDNDKDPASCPAAPDSNDKNRKDMKVDILGYRYKKFNTAITNRIAFNIDCQADTNPTLATAYCVELDPEPVPIPCAQCFGLPMNFKVDYQSIEQAPCSTEYDKGDLKIQSGFIPWVKNPGSMTATCKIYQPRDKNQAADKICADLRAPYTPLNKLKMRYHQPKGDKDNDVLPEGTPEGFTFREYFCDHMPYPRVWDIGTSIQKQMPKNANGANSQEPTDNYGQWTAIVGIGREGAPGSGQDNGDQGGSSSGGGGKIDHKDERCLIGGWGNDASFDGLTIKVPDPITSWTELKMYQTRTTREDHLVCLGRFEKVFKSGSSDGWALLTTGAEISVASIADCPKDPNSKQPCKYRTINSQNGGNQGGDQNTTTRYSFRQIAWPNAWRGYLSAKKDKQQFPNIGGSGSLKSGLDDAECGDIVVMPKGAVADGAQQSGLPKLGIITAVNLPNKTRCGVTDKSNCAQATTTKPADCYVDVEESDNGKIPDICGTTDHWKARKTVRFYKPGMLPQNVTDEAKRIKWTTKCEDPKLNACELDNWDQMKFYRIKDDVRKGK